jgi:hypothetical protein
LATTYPATGPLTCRTLPAEEGTVYLFVDGLRMDLARALEEKLISSGLEVRFEHEWSALPTVTATASMPGCRLQEIGWPLEEGVLNRKRAIKWEDTYSRAIQATYRRTWEFLSDI